MNTTDKQEEFVEKCRNTRVQEESSKKRWTKIETLQKTLGEIYEPIKTLKPGLTNKLFRVHRYDCPSCKEELKNELVGKKGAHYNFYIFSCTCGYKYAASGEYFYNMTL